LRNFVYPGEYGTHWMRRTKATLIGRHRKNLQTVQLFLGQSEFESTVRYLASEVDDTLGNSEQTEIRSKSPIGWPGGFSCRALGQKVSLLV
jgi:hypothetical protein